MSSFHESAVEARLKITVLEADPVGSLDFFVLDYLTLLEEEALNWKDYEYSDSLNISEINGRPSYRVIYQRWESAGFQCLERVVDEVFLSKHYPEREVGYVISFSACEHLWERYSSYFEPIFESFREEG